MESDKKWLNSDGRLCVHTTRKPHTGVIFQSGLPTEIPPEEPDTEEFNLSKICFEKDSDNNLSVRLRSGENLPSHIKFFWRYQPNENFDNVDAKILYGSIPGESRWADVSDNEDDDGIWWFHGVFADLRTGGCTNHSRSWRISEPVTSAYACPDKIQKVE